MNKELLLFLVLQACLMFGCSSKTIISSNMKGTDISEKLRAQLADARPGGEVKIPEGTFLLQGDFFIPELVSLIGSGSGRTFLKSKGGTVVRILNVSGVSVRGFHLSAADGHCSVSVRSGAPRDKKSARAIADVEIVDVVIDNTSRLPNWKNGKHGIDVKAVANENITGVLIKDCKVMGAAGEGSFEGFDNCYVASYDDAGSGQVRDVIIETCDFRQAGRQNLSIAGKGESKPAGIRIIGCNFFDSALAGVDLEEASDVMISGCTFRGNGLYTEYFTHDKPESSMRSGLVAHKTDVVVKNSTFDNCFYGYSSINTQGDGVRFTNCAFNNAPLDRGSFAGMANTVYDNCRFIGERQLINFYNASFRFNECTFTGRNPSTKMLAIGGGGIKRRKVGRGEFENCSFTGAGGVLLEANYETLSFINCSFSELAELITEGGNNRMNTLLFDDCRFNNVGMLGEFAGGSIDKLTVSNSQGTLLRSLLRSSLKNGEFRFEGNTFTLPADGSSLLGRYKRLVFINNTLHPAAAPGKKAANFLTIKRQKPTAGKAVTTVLEGNVATGIGTKISNE